MAFIPIVEDIFLFKDYINVYVLKNGNKAILIDFGSGEILEKLPDIGVDEIEYIFHTHYHRDQCYGDFKALEKDIKIAAPRKERKLFSQTEKFWRSKSYYHLYFFKPTFFVSTYDIPLARTFRDGETFKWNQYSIKIIETSGHTMGSVSYIVKKNNKIIAFTGDLIHSGSKVITYYDLEYKYGMDTGDWGMILSLKSFRKLLKHNPDLLLPSHGDVITDPKQEIAILEQKFEIIRTTLRLKKQRYTRFISNILLRNKSVQKIFLKDPTKKEIKEQFPHIIRPPFGTSLILLGNHQNCILMDFPGTNFPIKYDINGLEDLLEKHNIKTIDFLIPTHYHDDHVTGIPLLQEKYNIKVYALENMVDVLENPTHYRIPCLMETAIKVDRILKDGEILKWDDYEFEVFHFPGQTEYHMAMFGEVDGKKVLFAGDSFRDNILNDADSNLIAHSLCRLGKNMGVMKCAELLVKYNPQYIILSHNGILEVNEQLLRDYRGLVANYEPVIANVVAQENVNMGFDPHWIRFKPIRVITAPGKEFTTAIAVQNYLDREASIEIELNLPINWKTNLDGKLFTIKPNSYQEILMSITLPETEESDGRTICTANITWNGRKLGPIIDLMVDHGFKPPESWKGWTPKNESDFLDRLFNDYDRSLEFFK
ncbi:MAG: MBL fold metallo-hydrolase [Promethearchaeota archaeon]